MGFPGGAVVKNLPANAGDSRNVVPSLGQEDHLEKEMATQSVFLPGKFHRQRSLADYKELDMTELSLPPSLSLSLSHTHTSHRLSGTTGRPIHSYPFGLCAVLWGSEQQLRVSTKAS